LGALLILGSAAAAERGRQGAQAVSPKYLFTYHGGLKGHIVSHAKPGTNCPHVAGGIVCSTWDEHVSWDFECEGRLIDSHCVWSGFLAAVITNVDANQPYLNCASTVLPKATNPPFEVSYSRNDPPVSLHVVAASNFLSNTYLKFVNDRSGQC